MTGQLASSGGSWQELDKVDVAALLKTFDFEAQPLAAGLLAAFYATQFRRKLRQVGTSISLES